MTLDNSYVREGELDINKLFTMHDISKNLISLKEIEENVASMRVMLNGKAPECSIGTACGRFYECSYIPHCWRNIPAYSIFDLFRIGKAEAIYNEHKTADIEKLVKFFTVSGLKKVDLECFLKKKTVSVPTELRGFLNELKYPLYFLDYETIMPSIPMFDHSRPYQQIPFQFSLHVMMKPGDELEHVEYLHDERTDPRPKLIETLIKACGKKGSVIVYNAGFERGRNKEMARDFLDYAEPLLAINERMLDLLVPFRSRHLYCYKQQGSASLKKVLTAFTEISYDNLAIADGGAASKRFLAFMNGMLGKNEAEAMFADLRTYCGQDTLAMVELLKVVQDYAQPCS
jgi:hypothetical protein